MHLLLFGVARLLCVPSLRAMSYSDTSKLTFLSSSNDMMISVVKNGRAAMKAKLAYIIALEVEQ